MKLLIRISTSSRHIPQQQYIVRKRRHTALQLRSFGDANSAFVQLPSVYIRDTQVVFKISLQKCPKLVTVDLCKCRTLNMVSLSFACAAYAEQQKPVHEVQMQPGNVS